jgi:amylosucrase
MLNDYDFVKDPAKAGDTRWVHRPKMKWEFLDDLDDRITSSGGSIRKRIYRSLQRMISLRKSMPAFYGAQMELFNPDNDHVLGFVRSYAGSRVVVIANFSDEPCTVSGNHLRTAGLGRFFRDLITSEELPTSEDLQLEAYQILWLQRI